MSLDESKLEELFARKALALKFLQLARDAGVVNYSYIHSYVEQSLKEIEGFEKKEQLRPTPIAVDSVELENEMEDEPGESEYKPVSTFMCELGADDEQVRKFSSKFGRIAKAKYMEQTGELPHTSIKGSFVYTKEHMPILLAAYEETFRCHC